MSEWISVDKALPKANVPVILCRPERGSGVIVQSGTYTGVNGWWRVYGTRVKQVTHWMPLPRPPKEVGP